MFIGFPLKTNIVVGLVMISILKKIEEVIDQVKKVESK
jgi:hypothetical protein